MIRYDKDGISFLLCKNTNTATIQQIYSNNDVIIIPKEIKRYFKTYSVKSFDDNFYLHSNASQIMFEEDSNFETIGKNAFYRSFIQINIFPKSLKIISNSAFVMSQIQHIDLSKTQLEYIQDDAFNYSSLVDIMLPKSIRKIGSRAFLECKASETIEIPEDSDLDFIGYQAFAFSSLKNLTLPLKITDFDSTWFFHSPRINLCFTNTFGRSFHWYDDKHTMIADNNTIVFAVRNIKHARIGNDIKHIGSYAFNNCTKLMKVEFEKDSILESIGINSFACSSIESISIPKSVHIISLQAFYYCYKLKNIELPDDLKIGALQYGILHNTKIRSLKIPKNVYKIDETALADCHNLTSIEYLGCNLSFHCFAFHYHCCAQIFSCPNAYYFDFDRDILRRFSSTTIFFFKASNKAT